MKIFKEEQRFTQTWLIVLLAFSIIVPIVITTKEYLAIDSKITTNQFVLTLLGISISVAFIFFFKLKTRIDEIGIHYQFSPFHLKMKLLNGKKLKKYMLEAMILFQNMEVGV